jgi:predicted phage terminase large subunit-like protein
MIWFDELSLCNEEAWNDANLGLRLGPRPYGIATTTPKNRKWVKKLALDKTTYVPQYIDQETGRYRLPTTFDNTHLPQRRVDHLKRKFGHTRLGRQELEGAFVDDIEGAIIKRDWIKHELDKDKWPRMVRIVVAIDPAGSRSRAVADNNALTEDQRANQVKNADTAIAVMGLGSDHRFYLLAVEANQWSPNEWAQKAIEFFHIYRADKMIAEKNFGGDMVLATLQNINVFSATLGKQIVGRHVPIKLVSASRGKDIRAQPIATLYEQGKVTHCKYFGDAEDQLCAFVDADDNEGADMVDAIVWAGWELGGLDMGASASGIIVVPADPRFGNLHASVQRRKFNRPRLKGI